ncbi:MAG: Wzz/FepE/Etk N-terminal domain-containing protein [Chitinophagaceae bacterium]
MDSNKVQFDLFDIIRVFSARKKIILAFTAICSLLAAVYFVMQKNTYEAYGSFFPSSAVMSGRINLFREENQDWIDFFGGENELDRAAVIGNSAAVISYLIDTFHIADHYKIDVKNDRNGNQKVYKRFTKNFSISRSGYKHIEIKFKDEDHELAYKLVNESMNRIEDQLRKMYARINTQLAQSLDVRSDSLQRELTVLSDSLANMRVTYGIYDLIAPGRENASGFTPRSSGLAYAQGLERIQNLEELKNKVAIDRAKYKSLANEFKTATFDDFTMIHVTQWATPYGPKAGPYRTLGVLSVALISFAFAMLWAIALELFKQYKHRL